MISNTYDEFDLKCIEGIFNNRIKIKKHLRQYKLLGMMVDDFLVVKKGEEMLLTISFDGEIIKENGVYVKQFDK